MGYDDTSHLPHHYPWGGPAAQMTVAGRPGVAWPGRDELDRLTPVVAVGSNAAPEVLRRKLGVAMERGVPLSPATVEGLGVGHSAHVSVGGYVAAAPFADPGGRAAVTVGWFDADQLAAMDPTEPNYVRVRLPRAVRCVLPDGTVLDAADVYDSRHGVLGRAGDPLRLGTQVEVLAWLRRHLPDHGLDRPGLPERLADPAMRERLRRAISDQGLAQSSGL